MSLFLPVLPPDVFLFPSARFSHPFTLCVGWVVVRGDGGGRRAAVMAVRRFHRRRLLENLFQYFQLKLDKAVV